MVGAHPLLARQLRKCAPHGLTSFDPIVDLLALVDAAYRQQDEDRLLLEHSLQVVSDELTQRNRELSRQLHALEKMEVELRHALKLEAVGQLAAGIAHEINTPIQYIGDSVGYVHDAFAELAPLLSWYHDVLARAIAGGECPGAEDLSAEEERADVAYALAQIPLAIERTLEGTRRVASLVRAMKDFAHPDVGEKVAADLIAALHSTILVANSEIRRVADLELDLAPLPPIPCHLGEINQVFLNLLVNAAHAITDAGAGRGRITVRSRVLEDGVEVSVADTGIGIPAGIRDRIFEPFFTTKEVGRGTGQGLAIARSIIRDKHGGTIHFEARAGGGTVFVVRLPAVPCSVAAAPPVSA
jgi:signal transduction histidine kinase